MSIADKQIRKRSVLFPPENYNYVSQRDIPYAYSSHSQSLAIYQTYIPISSTTIAFQLTEIQRVDICIPNSFQASLEDFIKRKDTKYHIEMINESLISLISI